MSWFGDLMWKILPWQLRQAKCTHFELAEHFEAGDVEGCEECLKSGGEWLHLRRCMVCGKVGCCDQSPNTHARKHFEETGHPVLRSVEPEEEWGYCFPDEAFVPDVAVLRQA